MVGGKPHRGAISEARATAAAPHGEKEERWLQAQREKLVREGQPEEEAAWLSYLLFPEVADLFVTGKNAGTVKKHEPLSERASHRLLPWDMEPPRHRTCAVVGNSGALLQSRFGAAIDTADAVVRINQAPTQGYEDVAGNRTTYRLLNNKWSTVYYEENVPNMKAGVKQTARFLMAQEAPGTALVVTRADPQVFQRLASAQRRWRPDLRTLYLNPHVVSWTRKALAAFASSWPAGRQHAASDAQDLAVLAETAVPSTGVTALYFALQICDRVAVYGFSLMDSTSTMERHRSDVGYHYFKHYVDSEKLRTHPHHSFRLEGLLIQALDRAGMLSLCTPDNARRQACQGPFAL